MFQRIRSLMEDEKDIEKIKQEIVKFPSRIECFFEAACEFNKMELIEFIDERFSSDKILYHHCKEVTKWDFGLRGSCRGGHLHLIQEMIEKGAKNWNWGLMGACCRGDQKLIKMMEGYASRNWKQALDWNCGLEWACGGGHKEVIAYCIERGAKNWDLGLNGACCTGNLEVAQMMIDKGSDNFDEGLQKACIHGHVDVARLMYQMGGDPFTEWPWSRTDEDELAFQECAKKIGVDLSNKSAMP